MGGILTALGVLAWDYFGPAGYIAMLGSWCIVPGIRAQLSGSSPVALEAMNVNLRRPLKDLDSVIIILRDLKWGGGFLSDHRNLLFPLISNILVYNVIIRDSSWKRRTFPLLC